MEICHQGLTGPSSWSSSHPSPPIRRAAMLRAAALMAAANLWIGPALSQQPLPIPRPPEPSALDQVVDLLVPLGLDEAGKTAARRELTERINATPRRGFLYLAERGGRKVYIYGALDWTRPGPAFLPLNRPLINALLESSRVVLPLDRARMGIGAEEYARTSVYPPGDALARHVGPVLTRRALAQLAPSGGAQTAVHSMRDRPWAVANNLAAVGLARNGWRLDTASYSLISQLAVQLGKPVVAAETWILALRAHSSLREDLQQDMLRQAVESLELGRLQDEQARLLVAWQSGSLFALQRLVESQRQRGGIWNAEKFRQHDARTQRLVQAVEEALAEGAGDKGSLFVLALAEHLPGPTGLLQAMTSRRFALSDAQGEEQEGMSHSSRSTGRFPLY